MPPYKPLAFVEVFLFAAFTLDEYERGELLHELRARADTRVLPPTKNLCYARWKSKVSGLRVLYTERVRFALSVPPY